MTDFTGARARVGGATGLAGTGISTAEKTTITNDTTALKAATYITQTASTTLSAEQALSTLATGLLKVTTATGVLSTAVATDLPAHNHTFEFSLPFVLDGGGVAITTGTKYNSGVLVRPACTWIGWEIDATTTSNIVVTVERAAAGTPTNFISISGSGTGKPTLAAVASANQYAMTGATTTIAARDRIRVSVDSATALYATINLVFSRVI